MQFNSRRGRCTQNILKGKNHILIFWRQAGLLLLEDGKGKNITRRKKHIRNVLSVNVCEANRLRASIIISLPRMVSHYVCSPWLHIEVAMEAAINARVSIRALMAPFYRRILEPTTAPHHVLFDRKRVISFLSFFFLQMLQDISESKFTYKKNYIKIIGHRYTAVTWNDKHSKIMFTLEQQ